MMTKGGLGFLARSIKAPLARHYTDLGRMHAIPTESPLRVLVVAASPPDLPPVSTDPEIAAIQQALQQNQPELERNAASWFGLPPAKPTPWPGCSASSGSAAGWNPTCSRMPAYDMLQGVLLEAKNRQRPVHVVHFIGHGQGGARSNIIFEVDRRSFQRKR